MNITKEGDEMVGKSYNVYKMELTKARELLKEAVFFINQVPNNKFHTMTGETSYELASKIDKYLKA